MNKSSSDMHLISQHFVFSGFLSANSHQGLSADVLNLVCLKLYACGETASFLELQLRAGGEGLRENPKCDFSEVNSNGDLLFFQTHLKCNPGRKSFFSKCSSIYVYRILS